VNRERKNIRTAVGYYLPNHVIDQIAKNVTDLREGSRLVYGVCMYTDAGQYSTLSETVQPKELGRIMNDYYQTLFEPVKRHGGLVSNVIGDSMLALWIAAHPDPLLRHKACLTAIDIEKAVSRFSQSFALHPLATRISLHAGHILLGNIGAVDHYEYRPIGDIVNTATRVDSLNKFFGTHILVSDKVIGQLEGFLAREIGEFLLAGKTKSIVVHELLSRLKDATASEREACEVFSEGLAAFRRRAWDGAAEKFRAADEAFGKDKVSDHYINLCGFYKAHEPAETWAGVIQIEKK
ncbi:MAG: adenylate/guanylate cyclase domain-containing protein, partial [Nitrospirota bacterium]